MKALAKRAWAGLKSTLVLQREEHRASVQALNIFFGAIIGVAFGRIEDMPVEDYVLLLFITAAAVTAILIVSNTRRRLYSAIGLIGVMGACWRGLYEDPVVAGTPELLFPTLAVWAVMALLTEFTPQEKPPSRPQDADRS